MEPHAQRFLELCGHRDVCVGCLHDVVQHVLHLLGEVVAKEVQRVDGLVRLLLGDSVSANALTTSWVQQEGKRKLLRRYTNWQEILTAMASAILRAPASLISLSASLRVCRVVFIHTALATAIAPVSLMRL
mmetsp:Transcript_895/g.1499  ORF Transcript_895/g.1499 Transcript_895/m.1499 type:complete len:131 (+) Transcript_895:285-677(+)